MLMTDGILLLSSGTLEELLGEPMTGIDWLGFDTKGALGDMMAASMPDMAAMDEDLAAMTTDMTGLVAAQETAVAVARLADSEVDGVAVAVFEMAVDMPAMLDAIWDMLPAEDPNQTMLREATADYVYHEMSARQYIGLEDAYTHLLEMDLDIDRAPAGEETVKTVLGFDMRMSAFGEPVAVEIPEEAMVLPLAMMAQMGNAGS